MYDLLYNCNELETVMKNLDLIYICRAIGNLSGIPIRLLNGQKLVFFFSMVDLINDPVYLHVDAINSINNNIGYYVTPYFDYYGVVKCKNHTIIIGPTRQLKHTKQELNELAFLCDVPQESIASFSSALNSIPNMPLESLMQMLCVINYALNNEKMSLADVVVYDDMQKQIADLIETERLKDSYGNDDTVDVHNTLALEQTIMNYVKKGDIDALNEFIKKPVAANSGKIASNQIRQLKNIFIVSCTLVSRAAIRGGMDVNDAFSLSDFYIRKCELLNNIAQISSLQVTMIVDYTTRVSRLRNGDHTSKLTIEVKNYVLHHLSEQITTSQLAEALYMSRGYLCEKFKKESGVTLSDFILSTKIDEAKRLLLNTTKSISAIGEYLGFSSQSHFNNTFKKYVELTPKKYRNMKI